MTEAGKKLVANGISISDQEIARIARKYYVTKIEVFGSVVRSDFNPDSDIDLLITFNETSDLSLFDLMDLESEFSHLFKRAVDIVEPSAIRNPIRRKDIFASSELIYAA
jgi:uncharacterized protein